MAIPFREKKTALRGVLDLATGCYPRFIFGGSTNGIVPVFHFHDVTPGYLEPYLRHLAENGYKTLVSEDLAQLVHGKTPIPVKSVALCFDDAWTSLWTVVLPLLQKYSLQAITYVAPYRISGAKSCRPRDQTGNNTENPLFVTWPELKAIHASGVVDIQAHTHSHSIIFSSDKIEGFLTPETDISPLARPLLTTCGNERTFLSPGMLGHPLYARRSRMSDALRFIPKPATARRCRDYVAQNGKTEFFKRGNWKRELSRIAGKPNGRFETDQERANEICRELSDSRQTLESKLHKEVRHICMPWAVCGKLSESLAREAGYMTIVADTLFGKRFVHKNTNPYRIMRLKHQYIPCLPGKGRKLFLQIW